MITVTKVDNKGGSSITPTTGTVVPGTTFTYTIVVSNSGPSTATNVAVSDPLPAGERRHLERQRPQQHPGAQRHHRQPGGRASVTYTVTASVLPTASSQLVNTVSINGTPVSI